MNIVFNINSSGGECVLDGCTEQSPYKNLGIYDIVQ